MVKAAVKAKYIVGYAHSFSLEQLLGGLSVKPGILGINWYDSFDSPKPDGECPLAPSAKIRQRGAGQANPRLACSTPHV